MSVRNTQKLESCVILWDCTEDSGQLGGHRHTPGVPEKIFKFHKENGRSEMMESKKTKISMGVKTHPYVVKASNADCPLAVSDDDAFFTGWCCNPCLTLAPGTPRSWPCPLAQWGDGWWGQLSACLHASLS